MRILPALLVAIVLALPALSRSAPSAKGSAGPAIEAPVARPLLSADDEFELGLLHYARGEYRQAADAFARAGARLEPGRKPAARYWTGLSWLGTGDAEQARSAFEDVLSSASSLHPLAALGLAHSWELAHRPERALETLSALTREAAGEAAPAALARLAALSSADGQVDVARKAQERLLRDYPASMEAAAARLAAGTPPEAAHAVSVQIGAFADASRARSLADVARQSGLAQVSVVERAEAGVHLHIVLLGPFAHEGDARRMAVRAAERLGVAARVVSTP